MKISSAKTLSSGKIVCFILASVALCFMACTSHAQPGPGGRSQAPSQRERRAVNPGNETIVISVVGESGSIAPLLGVNAGPIPCGEPGNADLSAQYRWAGVSSVRTHDMYGPLDMSVVYPDINADPASQSSYDFRISDAAFNKMLNSDLEPYLRIGDSYNNVRIPRNDKERANLARAAGVVARHYCELADISGSKRRLRYIEIGNEPDNGKFWPAGFDDFLPFFAEAYSAIKKECPQVKVGGPGFVVSTYKIHSERRNIAKFFQFLRANSITPDFVSFHLYSNDPGEYYDIVKFYREAADRAGFTGTRLHITEWNTEREAHGTRLGMGRDAPFLTACWIALQEAGVDASYIFRGNDTNIDLPDFYGIFYADGGSKPTASAFHLWSRMTHYSRKLAIKTGAGLLDDEPSLAGDLKPLWLLAGSDDDGSIAILACNIGTIPITYTLSLPQGPVALDVDEIRPESPDIRSFSAPGPLMTIYPFSVQLIRAKK